MSLELIVPPVLEPIIYQQVLDHLRINPFDEEIDEASIAYIETLISAVRGDAEGFLNRALITQTWRYYLDGWPSGNQIEMPKPPLQSISSITIITDEGITAPTDSVYYLVDTVSNRGRIILTTASSWPTVKLCPMNPIKIQFVCGYGDTPEDVPKRIIQALLIGVADLYENRESVIVGQATNVLKLDTVERLLYPYKVWV
jgi:uncharacterized phiE125 gp8 family phage protein